MYPAHWFEVIDNLISKEDIVALVGNSIFADEVLYVKLRSCKRTVIITNDDDLADLIEKEYLVHDKCKKLKPQETLQLKNLCGATSMDDVYGDLDLWNTHKI